MSAEGANRAESAHNAEGADDAEAVVQAEAQRYAEANYGWNFAVNTLDVAFFLLALSIVSQATIMPLLMRRAVAAAKRRAEELSG